MDRLANLGSDVTSETHRRVAIIGGGYAGMAAAVSLAERSIPSTLFEAGKVLGGRARRVDYRGEIIDNGQHILSGAYCELLRLMALVGVTNDAVVRIPLTLSMPPHFSLVAPRWIAPFHVLWALLSAKGLAFSDRLAAVRFMYTLKQEKFLVSAADTVAALLATHQQSDRLIQYLWQPLTISALNTPIATASAQVFVNVLRDALAAGNAASDLILPRTDLSALFPDVAATWLATHGSGINRGQRVKSVRVADNVFQLDTDVGEATFDAVIVAIGPHQFDSIALPHFDASAPFAYEPITTIYLKFDQRVRLNRPMFGQVKGTAQWFFDRRQLGATDPASTQGDGLIAAVISASGPHEAMSQEQLTASVLIELTSHTGPLPPLAWHKVIAEKYATFACTPYIQPRRPAILTTTPGLFLTGDYTVGDYPATLEGAVRSGIQAGTHAARYLSKPGPS